MNREIDILKIMKLKQLQLMGCKVLIVLFMFSLPSLDIVSILVETKQEFVSSEKQEAEDVNTDIEDTLEDEDKLLTTNIDDIFIEFTKNKIIVKQDKLSSFFWVNLNNPPPELV